ncbi:MAG: LON peptidase substrate-binding domain-containing protein [Myxococcota bacterium]|nr:LON peptidase substrate-binding domain-containing protein [Myxococcota bacterium]
MEEAQIPLFPLSNVVLFPGCLTPLHVFEPRYRQMTESALEGQRLIGMVTVLPSEQDEMAGNPGIFPIGCAGFITDHEQLDDGRYNIVLRGTRCFRVTHEIPTDAERLYRLADVGFLDEPTSPPKPGVRAAVLAHLEAIAKRSGQSQELSLSQLEGLDDASFANVLCQALGFPPEEKQGLLEAGVSGERLDRLEGLLAFHQAAMQSPDPGGSGVVH